MTGTDSGQDAYEDQLDAARRATQSERADEQAAAAKAREALERALDE